MALIDCPECETPTSDKAHKCPSCGYTIRKPRRGPIGFVLKWLFILFNLLMIYLLLKYWGIIGGMTQDGVSDASKAGAVIGGTIGTGLLASVWVVGDIILGMLVLFTRPKY